MTNQIEIYQTSEDQTEIKVIFEDDTVWLNQKQMAELFEKDSDTISSHLKNIFSENELVEYRTTEYFAVVQKEGKREVKRNIDGNFSFNAAWSIFMESGESTDRFG